eukprot:TRINITY_DN80732_c0_g1_i1.p1 TRINITY_DN80732_c0_g1~~TRINITY_DN80732_c0_g1_i1.p1  ORF type:complete len:145 (-),score=37.58 TRINITY_DN80732_c0_g1_i1:189-623(-)
MFLANSPQLFPRVEVVPGFSDHSIPYWEINIRMMKKKEVPRKIPLYAKADWDSLNKVSTDPSGRFQQAQDTLTTEELWDTFRNTITEAVNSYIPHIVISIKPKLPWVTDEIRKLIHRRDRIYKHTKKIGSEVLEAEVKTLRRVI